MQQESLFDVASAAPSAAPAARQEPVGAAVPPAWAPLAIDACFDSQKKRWAALAPDARDAVVAAMWAYSQARERAMRSPLQAVDAPAALAGWIGADPALAALARTLSDHLVCTSDIPRPHADAPPAEDREQEQPRERPRA